MGLLSARTATEKPKKKNRDGSVFSYLISALMGDPTDTDEVLSAHSCSVSGMRLPQRRSQDDYLYRREPTG
jgi:hypothetical protein